MQFSDIVNWSNIISALVALLTLCFDSKSRKRDAQMDTRISKIETTIVNNNAPKDNAQINYYIGNVYNNTLGNEYQKDKGVIIQEFQANKSVKK